MKKIIKKVLPRRIKLFLIEHRYMFKVIKNNYKKELISLYQKNIDSSLTIDNPKKWINKLNKLSYSSLRFIELGKEFMNCDIKILKRININKDDVILICVEKNDLIKIKEYINYHRKIGIDKFVIIDNNSDDGSKEWLLKQEDVFLFETNEMYNSVRRVAWINRVISYFGDERWYLVLDSDELLCYNDIENKSIKDVIKLFKEKGIYRVNGLMLDMYAKQEYYSKGNSNNYLKECIYFDIDTYSIEKREQFIKITGGPRKRIFNIDTCLTKYPLFYFRKNDIYKAHFLYPYKENFNENFSLIIKHYKFLPNEIDVYKERVNNKNFYKESSEYKKYIDVINKKNTLYFMHEKSSKYNNSSSLNKINVYTKINWNQE